MLNVLNEVQQQFPARDHRQVVLTHEVKGSGNLTEHHLTFYLPPEGGGLVGEALASYVLTDDQAIALGHQLQLGRKGPGR